jgi:hypothetical protein
VVDNTHSESPKPRQAALRTCDPSRSHVICPGFHGVKSTNNDTPKDRSLFVLHGRQSVLVSSFPSKIISWDEKAFTRDDLYFENPILISLSVQIMFTWQVLSSKKDKKKTMYFSFRLRTVSVYRLSSRLPLGQEWE